MSERPSEASLQQGTQRQPGSHLQPKPRMGIRVRITLIALTTMALVLLLTAGALLSLHQRVLTDSLDESLASRSEEIETLLDSNELPPIITGQGDDDAVAQVVGTAGQVIASSLNFVGQPALTRPAAGRGTFRTVRFVTQDRGMRLNSRVVGDVVVHTAASIDEVEDSTAALLRGLLVTVPVAVILLGLVIWRTVGRALRPVDRISSRVGEITATNLHLRVPQSATDDEIGRLANTMNDMLDRLQRSAEQQQRFVADASHELRGPLTRIRTELEVDLLHPADSDLAATHRSVLDETGSLQQLIDDLLTLARLDAPSAGPTAAGDQLLDLDDIVFRETSRLRSAGRVTVDVSGVTAVQAMGHPEQLTRVIRNLADNAQRHARSMVTIGLCERDGIAQLTVADDGPGIAEADRERIFERFTRLDEARTSDSGGTGLGLAITREIVQRHGGTVAVDPQASDGATFVVRLPAVVT